MATINAERLLETFLELVRISSPSGEEADVANYCKKALEEAGCMVRFDDSRDRSGSNTGNLFATLAAQGTGSTSTVPAQPLYFSAHMDNVDPCRGVNVEIKDGYLYSDGTTVLGGDDKVGIAAIIEMVRTLVEAKDEGEAHPEIRIVLSVREEQGLFGAKAMDAAEFADAQGAFCYVLDAPGKPGLVINGAPYQQSYAARYTGLAAHAGIAPEQGISAIRAAARAITALPQGKVDEQTTTNIGTINGGTATNVVAAECNITGELRSQDPHRLLELKAEIDSILSAACASDATGAGAAQVDISWEVNYEGYYAPDNSPEVSLALSAARQLGFEARTEVGGGGADTNIFVSYGLAAVSLGSGMERIHSTDERLAVQDLEDLTRLALGIVKEFGRV